MSLGGPISANRSGSHCSGAMYASVPIGRVIEPTASTGIATLRSMRRGRLDMTTLRGFTSRCRNAPAVHVVECGAELEREGQELLEDDAVAANERREPRPVEMLENEVRALAVEDGVEHADDRRVAQRRERAGLSLDPAAGPLRVDECGADDLDDDERVQLVVPGEVRLVAPSATEQPGGMPTRDDLSPSSKPQDDFSCTRPPRMRPRESGPADQTLRRHDELVMRGE